MKHIISTVAVLLISCTMLCADDQCVEILLNKTGIDTRSIVDVPEATIFHDVLSVSFDAFGMYTLYIADSFGETIFTSVLSADGMVYTYDLSGIGEGMFTLTIEGPSGEYEGYFSHQAS